MRGTTNGRPLTDLLPKISQLCTDTRTKQLRWRCKGINDHSGHNCRKSWATPRNRSRVLKHAGSCRLLPKELRAEANELMSSESPSAKLERIVAAETAGNAGTARTPPVHLVGTVKESRTINKVAKVDGSLDAPSSTKRQQPLDVIVGMAGKQLLQAQLDVAIIYLICAACLAPTLVDYPQWRKVLEIANNKYQPASSSKLVDNQIPKEASDIRKATIAYLKTQYDLTVSYDGATTKKPQSVYTVHATTADGRSFLLDGNETSSDSHTGEHISLVILSAMDLVGREHFSGISGDSTGNTKLARKIVCRKVPTLINLPDICHHTSLAIKDIGRLEMFDEVCDLIIKWYHRSRLILHL